MLAVLVGMGDLADASLAEACQDGPLNSAPNSLASMASLACSADFIAKGCDKVKAALPEEEKSKVRSCTEPQEPLSPRMIASACWAGAENLVSGVANAIINLPGNIAQGYRDNLECWESQTKREELLRPVDMLLTPEMRKHFQTTATTCDQLLTYRNGLIRRTHQQIAQKKTRQIQAEQYGRTINETDKLTPKEEAFLEYQALTAEPALLERLANDVKEVAACYTTRAQAQIVCEALVIAATGGVVGAGGRLAMNLVSRSLARHSAIRKAHLVGHGELGADGVNPAGIGNYTREQLRRKAEILDQAGIPLDERRALIESGRVGDHLTPAQTAASLASRRGLALPDGWPPESRAQFEKALQDAAGDRGQGRHAGSGPPRSISDIHQAIVRTGHQTGGFVPEIVHETGGKVVLRYPGMLKTLDVKINVINGQHYFTIIERSDGRTRYLRHNNRGGLEACPPQDMASCHMPIAR